ncbi:MAG: hypothetical protein FWC51_03950 [Proteobacteria bacterium]|nr:hypothetical protein [Pseudomonadota bacterium]
MKCNWKVLAMTIPMFFALGKMRAQNTITSEQVMLPDVTETAYVAETQNKDGAAYYNILANAEGGVSRLNGENKGLDGSLDVAGNMGFNTKIGEHYRLGLNSIFEFIIDQRLADANGNPMPKNKYIDMMGNLFFERVIDEDESGRISVGANVGNEGMFGMPFMQKNMPAGVKNLMRTQEPPKLSAYGKVLFAGEDKGGALLAISATPFNAYGKYAPEWITSDLSKNPQYSAEFGSGAENMKLSNDWGFSWVLDWRVTYMPKGVKTFDGKKTKWFPGMIAAVGGQYKNTGGMAGFTFDDTGSGTSNYVVRIYQNLKSGGRITAFGGAALDNYSESEKLFDEVYCENGNFVGVQYSAQGMSISITFYDISGGKRLNENKDGLLQIQNKQTFSIGVSASLADLVQRKK